MLSTNTNILDGKNVSADEFRSVCESGAVFYPKKDWSSLRDCWTDSASKPFK